MRVHLYEFRASERKLCCSCGWARTVKTVDAGAAAKLFRQHCKETVRER